MAALKRELKGLLERGSVGRPDKLTWGFSKNLPAESFVDSFKTELIADQRSSQWRRASAIGSNGSSSDGTAAV